MRSLLTKIKTIITEELKKRLGDWKINIKEEKEAHLQQREELQ